MWAEIPLPTFSCEGRIILDLFTAKNCLFTSLNLNVFPSVTARFLNFAEIEKMLILLPLTHTSTRATALSYKN